MKILTLLGAITFVAVVSAVLHKREADTDYSYYVDEYDSASDAYEEYQNDSGWFVPTANGTLYWVSKEEWNDTTPVEFVGSGSPKFYLYTNLNPEQPTHIYLNNVDSIMNSNFDITNPTRFLIHGFTNDGFSEFPTVVRKALISAGTYNVIVVDWSSMSSKIYHRAKWAVPEVGREVANFIDFLNMEIGMPFEDLTLIGHSLGAHACGFVGKHVKNGKIDVIIGLDPAYPLYYFADTTERLCETDANFVESIQTTTLLGFSDPIGLAAFFPNGGRKQPGCGLDLIRSCAHSMSYTYYAEAILADNFRSIKCKTREEAYSKCGKTFSNVRMGSPKKYGSLGIYYVPVNDKPPYGGI